MKTGVIHSVIDMLIEAFSNLPVQISLKKIERLAILLHKVMNTPGRSFHTLDHVFSISDSSDPILSLAALFHDIVYYHVDKSISPDIYQDIFPYIQKNDGDMFIADTIPSDDRLVVLTLEAFGFETGQKLLPFAGLNEFLSALVINKELGGFLPENDLLRITICIEATIPFRGQNEQGESWAEIIERRLRAMNHTHNLSLLPNEIEKMIKRAIILANNDVKDFATKNIGKFLDNTWKLLPETNIALRSGECYSIKDFRKALQKMEGFLKNLNPDNIFHCYKGVPPDEEFQHLVKQAHSNIHIAREYLGIKLLAMAIIEALADMTGGDAPLALFMGDIRKEGHEVKRLEDFLPIDLPHPDDRSSSVVTLLNAGRTSDISFDMRNSPTSFFLYQNLELARIRQLLHDAKEMFEGKLSAQEFLGRIDRPVVSAIARASASMVVTRREKLLRYTLPECSEEQLRGR